MLELIGSMIGFLFYVVLAIGAFFLYKKMIKPAMEKAAAEKAAAEKAAAEEAAAEKAAAEKAAAEKAAAEKAAAEKAAAEKAAAEKAAAEKAAAEKAAEEKRNKKQEEEFWATFNVVEAVDGILSVLEKSGATAGNFEKGVAHVFNKKEIKIPEENFLVIMKNELFARAFADNASTTAKSVFINYFKIDLTANSSCGLYKQYIRYYMGGHKSQRGAEQAYEVLIKYLHGIAGRVFHYSRYVLNSGDYQPISPEYYIEKIIAVNTELKSYTDKDPFTMDEVRKEWANDLYNAPLELVKSSELSSVLNDEKRISEAFYLVYLDICQRLGKDSDGTDGLTTYHNYMEEIHEHLFKKESESERAARMQKEAAEQAARSRCRACINYYKCSYDVQKQSLSCSAFCPK